jgi:FkbM family methyltransferase
LPGIQDFGRIPFVRSVYAALFKFLVPRSVVVQGHRMWLDRNDTLELATRELYEPTETGIVLREVKSGDVVLDIGANIGYYTLIMARLTGPSGQVFAFEPDALNFQLLQKNVQQARYSHVAPVNSAVSDRSGEGRLYRNEVNGGDHRLYDSSDGRASVAVRVVAIDDFLSGKNTRVHFVKMDIQGAEMAALRGMQSLIRDNPGIKLLTEFWPAGLNRSGTEPRDFLRLLTELGFEVYEVSEEPESFKCMNVDGLLERHTVENDRYTNLFCIKAARQAGPRTAREAI